MDKSTIFSMQAGLLMASAAALHINWKMNRMHPEARYWFYSFSAAAAGAVIAGFATTYPDPLLWPVWIRLVMATGNMFYIFGHVLFYLGVCCFVERRHPSGVLISLILLVIAFAQVAASLFTVDHYLWRSMVSTVCLATISAVTTWTLLFSSRRRPSLQTLFAALVGAMTVILAVRSGLLMLVLAGIHIPQFLVSILPYYFATILLTAYTITVILLAVRKLHLKLKEQASTDFLTGVLNRRAFFEVAVPVIANAVRSRLSITVVMADLDHFKSINDRFGHSVGDRVLKSFVEITKQSLRTGDVFARVGGEEFVVLLTGGEREDSLRVTERVRDRFAHTDISIEGESFRSTASFGVVFMSGPEYDLQALLDRADKALYHAKAMGRNKVITDD